MIYIYILTTIVFISVAVYIDIKDYKRYKEAVKHRKLIEEEIKKHKIEPFKPMKIHKPYPVVTIYTIIIIIYSCLNNFY